VRRIGVELLIVSSRLVLPVALVIHLLVAWSVAAFGGLACLATLAAPGIAEIVWLAWLGPASAPGHIVLVGGAAIVALVVLTGIGMIMMSWGEAPAPNLPDAAERP